MKNLTRFRSIFDIENLKKRINEIEYIISKNNFWNETDSSKTILKERAAISEKVETWQNLKKNIEESKIFLDLAMEESDKETAKEVSFDIETINKKLKSFSVSLMLKNRDDSNNAIISINAGAGGTDSQDWTEMLFKMYSRWVSQKGFDIELIDLQYGDEAGIKSVTFTAKGQYAFGYLKSETGVHRLVRISPYNASGKRHTSFASVYVCPELTNEIVVELEDKDLRIDVFRASGAGGQHVNKTSSAVRITHLPSKIVVQCQQEKSQLRNKELAFKVLKSRLYQRKKQQQDEKIKKIHDNKSEIAWGSQIRSYVLHPYRMVKDHRINMEIGNINSVLNGNIDPFIEGVLLFNSKLKK